MQCTSAGWIAKGKEILQCSAPGRVLAIESSRGDGSISQFAVQWLILCDLPHQADEPSTWGSRLGELIVLEGISIWAIIGKLVLTLILGLCFLHLSDPKGGDLGKLYASFIVAFILIFFV